eukprot:GILI01015530.1.p1 GENE.GILI01015530.1~~GILI01015530.1.p1  ORF type:complete len:196 (-),score=7.26 GILI01015530.1:113-700(-)
MDKVRAHLSLGPSVDFYALKTSKTKCIMGSLIHAVLSAAIIWSGSKSSAVIALGSISLFISLFGLFGSLRESKILVRIYLACMLLVIFFMFVGGSAVSSYTAFCSRSSNQCAADCCGTLEQRSSDEYSAYAAGLDDSGRPCFYQEFKDYFLGAAVILFISGFIMLFPAYWTWQLSYELSKIDYSSSMGRLGAFRT